MNNVQPENSNEDLKVAIAQIALFGLIVNKHLKRSSNIPIQHPTLAVD